MARALRTSVSTVERARKHLVAAETRHPLAAPAWQARTLRLRGTSARARPTCSCSVAARLGGRQSNVTARRTRVDFALRRRLLVDDYFPPATTVRVVLDNPNTHNPASLYEAFAPKEAKRLLDRPEFVSTHPSREAG